MVGVIRTALGAAPAGAPFFAACQEGSTAPQISLCTAVGSGDSGVLGRNASARASYESCAWPLGRARPCPECRMATANALIARIDAAEPRYRVAPSNIEAEQALLGAILVNNEAYYRVSDFLEASHFHDDLHRRVYEPAT